MKRIISFFALIFSLTMSLQAQDWRDELLANNAGVIDSIVLLNDPRYEYDSYESYMIYYNQPIRHDASEEGSLPLRALMMVNTQKSNFKNSIVQMNLVGYDLDDGIINNPNCWADQFSDKLSTGEISGLYRGHFIMPEHRFYGKSRFDGHVNYLSDCNAKESADDTHALADAIKKVFTGPWAITGVSKGGVAAAIQHAYYPEDADCFVSYVSPFPNSEKDLRVQEYWLTKSWTPELREHAMHIQKEILNRPKVFEYFYNYLNNMLYSPSDLRIKGSFLNTAVNKIDESAHQNLDRTEVEKIFNNNKEFYQKRGLTDYSDEMLFYMLFSGSYEIDDRFEFIEEGLFSESESGSTRAQELPTSLSNDELYSYQSLTELGYYDIIFDYYYDTKEEADSVNTLFKSYCPAMVYWDTPEAYKSFEYDPSLMDFVKQQVANTSKPMIFIYGEDDPWTGACIDNEYINGDNVRKYILPAQCHTANIKCLEDSNIDLQNDLYDFIDKALYSQATAINNVNVENTNKNSEVYDLNGRRVNGVPERGVFMQNGKKMIK